MRKNYESMKLLVGWSLVVIILIIIGSYKSHAQNSTVTDRLTIREYMTFKGIRINQLDSTLGVAADRLPTSRALRFLVRNIYKKNGTDSVFVVNGVDTTFAFLSGGTGVGSGTVTDIATNAGTGITGGPITVSGTLALDTGGVVVTKTFLSTRGYLLLSDIAGKLNISDTANMLLPYILADEVGALYYTKVNLQTSGQASVHWDNITNEPTFLTAEVDGSTTNELQNLSFTGASTPYTLNISSGTGVTFAAGTGISLSRATNELTIATTITQYTDALARAAISESVTGLDYSSATGVLSLTTGYVIPTTTQETNWNTAYTNRITSLTTTGNSGAATLISNVLNIPNYTLAGLGGISAANLTFSGASSPVSLLSDVGTDVVFTAGTGISFSQTGNNLTITSTVTDTDIYWTGTATNLNAATGRTSLGATTVGSNLFTATNPSAISYPKIAADNTVSFSSLATLRGDVIATFTTTGNSGSATWTPASGTLNIPTYTLAGLGGISTANLTFTGSGPYTLASDVGTDVTFTQGSGITLTRNVNDLTIAAVDVSATNEIQTYAHSGTTSYTNTLSNSGGSFTLQAAGIASISHTTGTVTITATEVDGSTTNEIQTLTNSNAAGSHTITLSSNNNSLQLIAGTNVTFTTGGTASNGTLTIDAAGGSGSTDLTFTGASSPYTLNSSSGADVTFAQGTGITLTRNVNELSIALTSNTISGIALGSNLNSVTFNNAGTGDASGTTYNGSTARTISYNTIGAQAALSGTGFVKISGTTISYDNSTYLTAEVDGSISNEGILGVGAGAANTATLTTNTSTGSAVTFSGAGNISITESTSANGGTITITGTDVGFANPMTTLGDIIYGGSAGAPTRLAGNTTTTKNVLLSTGTGAAANAPAWGTLTAADVGAIATGGQAGSVAQNLTIGAELISGGPLTYNGSVARTIGIQAGTVTNAMLAGSIDLTTKVTGDLPFANLAQGSARSVLGVSGNATADVASIQSSGADQILISTATTIGWGALTTNAITNNAVTVAKMQQLAGLSVLGRSASTTGDMAAITGTDGQVLRVSGTTLGFGTVTNAGLANSSITINGTSVSLGGTRTLTLASADFVNQGTTTGVLHGNADGNPSWGQVVSADIATNAVGNTNLRQGVARSVIGVTGNATANVADIQGTTDQVLRVASDGLSLGFGTIATGGIANAAVTLAKMANINSGELIYRKTAGAGAPEVQTLATLKTDLGLTGTNSGDQTITNSSDATSHTVTLSASGGTIQFVEGSNITLTTSGTAGAGIVTIASTGGAGVTDGDKGDITVSGTGATWTLDARTDNSAASTPVMKFAGTWFTGGTSTTTTPHFLIEPTGTTSTGWSTAGTGLGINANTGFTGNLIDAQLTGGTNRFYVNYAGNVVAGTTAAGYGIFASPDNSHLTRNAVYNGSTWNSLKSGAAVVFQTSASSPLTILYDGSVSAGAEVLSFTGLFEVLNDGQVKSAVTNTLSSGSFTNYLVAPTINQSSTAGFRAMWISPYLQTTGSGSKLLLDVGTNSAGGAGGVHTSIFNITSAQKVNIEHTTQSNAAGLRVAMSTNYLDIYGGGSNVFYLEGSAARIKLKNTAVAGYIDIESVRDITLSTTTENDIGNVVFSMASNNTFKVSETVTTASLVIPVTSIHPTINQINTGGFKALQISPYLQQTGSGSKRLLDVGTNSAAGGAVGTHTSLFSIQSDGKVFANSITNATQSNVLYYDAATKEITYGTATSGQGAIQFKDEGTNQGTSGGITSVDFVGAGVSASATGGALTVTIAGGGGVSGSGTTGNVAGFTGASAIGDAPLSYSADNFATSNRNLIINKTAGEAVVTLSNSSMAHNWWVMQDNVNGDFRIRTTPGPTDWLVIADDGVTTLGTLIGTGTRYVTATSAGVIGSSTSASVRADVIATFTTSGSSGAATWNSSTGALNIPTYTLVGLGGLADAAGNGYLVRTSANTTTNRTLTGTSNRLTVTNGDGSVGNPVFDVVSTSDATASRIMERDANANTKVNNVVENLTSTTTAAGTTTLTVSSSKFQAFTGTTTQTMVLPNATTLTVGHTFYVHNQSTGAITVQTNGGATLKVVPAESDAHFTATAVGTAAGTWEVGLDGGYHTKSITMVAPTASENVTLWYTTKALTVVRIDDVTAGTSPSVTWNVRWSSTRTGTPTDLLSANRTTTSTTGATTSTFANSTIPAGSWIWLITSATSGTVNDFHVSIHYKE